MPGGFSAINSYLQIILRNLWYKFVCFVKIQTVRLFEAITVDVNSCDDKLESGE